MRADRIFIFGPSGSGKTTLAAQVGERIQAPVHELDLVARVGGGNGPERSADEREQDLEKILSEPRWVAEGVHLGWTDRLLAAADVIVWLDHVALAGSSARKVRRFMTQAVGEARRQRGVRRFLRVRDYLRHLRELGAAIGESRRDHSTTSETRAAADDQLARYEAKVVRCRTAADVTGFVSGLEGYA